MDESEWLISLSERFFEDPDDLTARLYGYAQANWALIQGATS